MVAVLTTSARLASLGLLKINVFWNKRYDVIISAHDQKIWHVMSPKMTCHQKILSCDSNCIVDVVMWPKLGNSSISIREVIITSILFVVW